MESAPGESADRQRALELAHRYVDRRERTADELRRHLRARDFDDATAEEAIEELTQLGVLDDARFARLFTQDKRELEGWGTDRIKRGLLSRGIDRGLIEEALGGEESESELDRALCVLRRRFPSPVLDRRDRERALGVLLRKGYDNDLALEAVRSYAHAAADL